MGDIERPSMTISGLRVRFACSVSLSCLVWADRVASQSLRDVEMSVVCLLGRAMKDKNSLPFPLHYVDRGSVDMLTGEPLQGLWSLSPHFPDG